MENAFKWSFTEKDKEVIRDLEGFVPDRIFDIHAHIYRTADLNLTSPGLWDGGGETVSIEVWKRHVSRFFPRRKLEGGLFFPAPLPNADIQSSNDFLVEQLEMYPESRGLALVTPHTDMGQIRMMLEEGKVTGLKPYHVYSTEMPTSQSSIKGFFPESLWQLADEYNAVVMLHIMKDKAISDPVNMEQIREMCMNFPGIKLILAHAARCFHSPNAKAIQMLRGLENVWFDMSGICEPEVLYTILQQFGPKKLMWGSDFPISEIRGKAVTIGDGFMWMDGVSCDWSKAMGSPVLVGMESLRALRIAAGNFGLNKKDLQDIFGDNAVRLLGIEAIEENQTQELYQYAKTKIPGGGQLLSKRPENLAPGFWPAYFRESRGCEVWDLDGRHYYDMSTNAVGSCLLGYADPDVNQEVVRRVHLGNMSSLNPPEEVELADKLCAIHPWADQARFVRGGGEACAMAVRIARATTDRPVVAVCGYHGWQDWYLAANLGNEDALRGHLLPGLDPLGVPSQLRDTALTFKYNDVEGFKNIVDRYGRQLAAVVMEPCRNIHPAPGFLEYIRQATRDCGALLIFDEITVGWRMHYGGAHLLYGIQPDMAVFAKALGNGFPIGVVIGTGEAMDGAHRSFISSTYWTESIGPVAALATLEKMGKSDVPGHIAETGAQVLEYWKTYGQRFGLPVQVSGFPCLASFSFQDEEAQKLRTVYTQKMLELGFLAGTSIYPTMAHTREIVQKYGLAIEEVFGEISRAFHDKNLDRLLKGEVAKSGFARLI